VKSISASIIVLSGSICLAAVSMAHNSPFQLAMMILGGVLIFMGLMTWARYVDTAEARERSQPESGSSSPEPPADPIQ
jgi:hypothetical protein